MKDFRKIALKAVFWYDLGMIKTVSKAPKEYLQQGLTQCGAYTVKAILSAYGKDDGRHPRDYQPNLLAKYTSITGSDTWPKVLRSYGLMAEMGNTKELTDEERIRVYKNLIDKDTPVMIRIGNGYLRSGGYSKLIAHFMGHWITLWGYNDEEKVFYIYDSYVPVYRYDKTLPIGNVKRTFAEVLRDVSLGFPWQWRYNYIRLT